jgi:hypothetical protein
MFTHLPNSSHDAPTIAQDTATISKMGCTIAAGLLDADAVLIIMT